MAIINPKLQVFLCHASQDKLAVRELYNALIYEDWIDPWLDKAKILPGQDWRMVIEQAVEESDVVVICLSNKSIGKEGYVQKEIKYAYDIALEKPEETIFLIPLRLEECSLPRGLRSLQWVDYFGAEKLDNYANLLAALKLRYEQRLPSKIEETVRKQNEEKERQEYEESRRREQDRARRLIEERQREVAAKQELANKKTSYNANYNIPTNAYSLNDLSESTVPKKNTSRNFIIIIAVMLFSACCLLAAIWQYGDAILQALGG